MNTVTFFFFSGQADLPINRGTLRLLSLVSWKKEANLRNISPILLKESNAIIVYGNLSMCTFDMIILLPMTVIGNCKGCIKPMVSQRFALPWSLRLSGQECLGLLVQLALDACLLEESIFYCSHPGRICLPAWIRVSHCKNQHVFSFNTWDCLYPDSWIVRLMHAFNTDCCFCFPQIILPSTVMGRRCFRHLFICLVSFFPRVNSVTCMQGQMWLCFCSGHGSLSMALNRFPFPH